MVDPHERLTHVAVGQLLLQRAMVMTWLQTPVYRCPDLRIAQLCRIAEIDAALRMLLDGGQSNGEPKEA